MPSNLLKDLLSVTLLLALMVWVSQALAEQVQLAWNAPTTNTDGTPLTDLAGYHLYYWQDSTGVPQSVDVGNTTNYTLTGLVAGATYTLAVAAYNTAGNQSSYSSTITVIIPFVHYTTTTYTTTTLALPGSTVTSATGINDVGQIVGYFVDAMGYHGFLYTGGSFSTLDVPGSTVTFATGINDVGQIVGYFGDAMGRHGFVATPVP